MKYLFSYYYFRMYKYYSNGGNIPQFRTLTTITVFFLLNILTLFTLVFDIILGKNIILPTRETHGYFWSLIPICLLLLLLYYYLNVRGYHFRIMEQFENETKKAKKRSGILTIAYFVLSFGFFVLILYLRQIIRKY